MTDDTDPPPISKLTRSKQRWAREGRFLTGKTSRPEEQRLPPGQHLTRDWPVLDLGADAADFPRALAARRLRRGRASDLLGFRPVHGQPQTKFISDIHCVTTWSRYDNQWEGLATRDLLMACQPRDEARFVVLHSHDGYTTNLALEDFAAEDALLAHSWSGAPLEAGAWRPGAAGGAASLFLEEREMAAEHRIPRPRMRRAIGKSAAITTAAIRGPKQRYSGD